MGCGFTTSRLKVRCLLRLRRKLSEEGLCHLCRAQRQNSAACVLVLCVLLQIVVASGTIWIGNMFNGNAFEVRSWKVLSTLREPCCWRYIWNALFYQTHTISQRAEPFTQLCETQYHSIPRASLLLIVQRHFSFAVGNTCHLVGCVSVISSVHRCVCSNSSLNIINGKWTLSFAIARSNWSWLTPSDTLIPSQEHLRKLIASQSETGVSGKRPLECVSSEIYEKHILRYATFSMIYSPCQTFYIQCRASSVWASNVCGSVYRLNTNVSVETKRMWLRVFLFVAV